jgi:hypothetical protein
MMMNEEESFNEEMLTDSSNEDKLIQLMLSSAASARHTVDLMMDLMEDSDEESEREWGTGSRPGKAANKARDFKGAYERLFKNYFSTDPPPVYNDTDFERRFRMPRAVFNRISEKIIGKGLYGEKVQLSAQF